MTLGELIHQTIDFEDSTELNRVRVMQGVDSGLDELVRLFAGLGSLLTEISTQLRQEIPAWAAQYIRNCVFFPQLGYLTEVTLNPETGMGHYAGGSLNSDAWEMVFRDETSIYFKNKKMRDLDANLGDLFSMISGMP